MKSIKKLILIFMLGITPSQWVYANSKIDVLADAAMNGNLAQVKSLIGQGVDVNLKNKEGFTALTKAVMKGHLEVVKYLVSKGADVNAKNRINFTALIIASSEGHLEIVKYLIDNGANVNDRDNDGFTALMWASGRGRLEVVKFLISKGADVNVAVSIKAGNTVLNATALDTAKTSAIKEVLRKAGAKSAKEIKGR